MSDEMKKNGKGAADWLGQLRYSRSFTAKLLLSEPDVKEYYSEIATELLSYERVRSHTGWSGVSFIAGRVQIAKCTVSGKTLCLYLAASPDGISGSKYKARDVADVRKYEKTPALLKIKSRGGARNAVQCISEVAIAFGLEKKNPPPEPILAKSFPADSFHNLVTRGLIRFVRGKSGQTDDGGETEPVAPQMTEPAAGGTQAEEQSAEYRRAYGAIAGGDAVVRLSEKKMLRALDEKWVSEIEDALPAIDELMRRPSHFIAETEEVLPMELTRKITGRSVEHLCRHTDYISSVNGDEVTPSKLLNVFREDSVLTYENKFLNTLISHLYFFVTKRYKAALENGVDEVASVMSFEDDFSDGDARGKIRISIELSEKTTDADGIKKGFLGTPLWARVEKLNGIVKGYTDSEFVRMMGRNYVKPPILRTNAILKNKYFRRCLELWNFLEGYDESGLGITVCENVREPEEDYVNGICDGAAKQYMLFRERMKGGETVAEYTSDELFPKMNVRISDGKEDISADDFDIDVPSAGGKTSDTEDETFVYDPAERDMVFAVRVALRAAEFYDRQAEDEDDSDTVELRGVRYEKTFEAKLRLADDKTKGYFVSIANALLSYDGVKMRMSRTGCAFSRGRKQLARLTFKGRSLCFYVALDPFSLPDAYRVRDVSGIKRYASTPALLRVRSARWQKYALSLVTALAEKESLAPSEKVTALSADDFEIMTFDGMISAGLIRRISSVRRTDTEETVTEKTDDVTDDIPPLSEPELFVMPEPAAKTPNAEDEHTAQYFEGASSDPESYPLPEKLPETETTSESERLLPDIRYPGDIDYSHPTLRGVDDSSGFIKDTEENSDMPEPAEEQDEKAPEGGFFARLFRRKKHKNTKKSKHI